MPIVLEEEQASTVGGVFITSSKESSPASDCALHVLAYLSGNSYKEMENYYINSYLSQMWGVVDLTEKEIENLAKSYIAKGGKGVHGGMICLDNMYHRIILQSILISDTTAMRKNI